jgi:alkyl hydroperoxide reductase subunit F
MYELIIIGGGPAGIAAGIYASRKRIHTLIATKDFGGQSINAAAIENFIGFRRVSGLEFAKSLEEHLREQKGIDIRDGVSIVSIRKTDDGFELESEAGETFRSRTLLLAMGSRYKRLGAPGEREYEGRGVFYCSICDAPLMKGSPVAVIGGGNSGLEAALDLLPHASQIYILDKDDIKGDPVHREELERHPQVNFITHAQATAFFGSSLLEGVRYQDLKTGASKELDVRGAFVAVGYTPNSAIAQGLVKLNERGEIIVDHRTHQTSHECIWAAGDITDGYYHQINTAIGEGVEAILNIYDYLRKKKCSWQKI